MVLPVFVAIPQVQLFDEVVVLVVCNDICPGPAALHSGGATGAAHHQGPLHLVAAQSLIPMALTVQQTIEISRLQFLDKELTCPLLGHTGASWCSTGAALGQGCRARCVHDKCPDPDAQYSGGAAVAVPLHGRQHPCRSAGTASHGLTFQRQLRFSCSSTLTKWLMLVLQVRQLSSMLDTVGHMPVVVQRQVPWLVETVQNLWVPAVGIVSCTG